MPVIRTLLIPIVLALTTLSLSACGDDDDATPATAPPVTSDATLPEPGGVDLDGREFLSTSVEGYTLVEGTTLRLSFSDGALSANAGCNTIFGGYTVDGGTLAVDTLGTTEMACETDLR
jgi:heat shock protein HslJ